MSTIPQFTSKPGLHFPRPDRLPWRSLFLGGHDKVGGDSKLIVDALAKFDLPPIQKTRKIQSLGRSRSWVIKTETGDKVLKRYKAGLEREQIQQEHSILEHLAEVNFPAPRLNYTRAGESLVEVGGAGFALTDYLPGYFQYHHQVFIPSQSSAFLHAAGAALAELHDTLREFEPLGKNMNGFTSRDGPRWRGLDWYRQMLSSCRSDLQPGAEMKSLLEQAGWMDERLLKLDEQLARANPPRLIIHGDYGPYNLLFRLRQPVVIIDYELSRLDWRLTDLAASMNTFGRSRLGFHLAKMKRFLSGYQSRQTLSSDELELLPLVWEYLSLRRAVVCWRRLLDTKQPSWRAEMRDRLRIVAWLRNHPMDWTKL